MTIRIIVKNDESPESERVIEAEPVTTEGKPYFGGDQKHYVKTLKGGESAEFNVHGGYQVLVREV